MLCFFLFYICCVIVLFPFWLAYIFLSQYCFHEGDEAIEDLYNRKYAGQLDPANQNQQVVQQSNYEAINQNCVQPNQNYIQPNQSYTQMNQNYGQMNQNYVQVTPNYAPMNPNCVPMNPNYVPMNQNQVFNPPQVYDQSNPYTMNQPLI